VSKTKSNVVICDNGRRNTHLSNKDPERYKAILDALIEGEMSMPAIAAKYGTAKGTIQQIKHDNADKLPDWKQRTERILSDTVVKMAKDIDENFAKIPAQSKALSLAILSSKLMEIQGNSTGQVHKHVHIHNHGAVSDLLAGLRGRNVPTDGIRDDQIKPVNKG
jgi:hypothetical protein